jgi:tyrosyl-tRNA synthetase
MNLIEELRWRGMLHDIMPGTEEHLLEGKRSAYIGFDPTSDSLHIGSLVPIMILVHVQRAGHQPIALVGGATGMVGDPSGKSAERNLLDEETLSRNQAAVRQQLSKFLDFENADNPALMVNNYDWFRNYNFLDFIRDVGKHITVNYMMAKDSVKSRLETGISYTEFTYQLVQGYDFVYLKEHHNCTLQFGGSDQWGNITTGTELIRRMGGGEAFAATCPLVKKADGGKFGKTESGNIWLDREKTSPYKFYQFWLNASDEDAKEWIRIFTLLEKNTIRRLEEEHEGSPHLRILQKALAEDITIRVHSLEDFNNAVAASGILFGKSTKEALYNLDEQTFLDVFEGVPQATIDSDRLTAGIPVMDFMTEDTGFLPSKGEARRTIQGGGLNINQEKVEDLERMVTADDLIAGKYIVVRKGKKNYSLAIAE